MASGAKRTGKTGRRMADTSRKTANPIQGNKPFVKGYDPRRNYKGRPTSHDELREIIRNVGEELLTTGDGKQIPRLYAMLVKMFASPSAVDRENILEHGWGKVPQAIQLERMSDDELRSIIATAVGADGGGSAAVAEARPADSPAASTAAQSDGSGVADVRQ